MLIAQITDTHVGLPGELTGGVIDTAACLQRCVQRVAALEPAPDLVVLTGDLVDRGSEAEYARLRELLSGLPCPYLLMPGNHDERGAMRRSFADHAYLCGFDEFIQFEHDQGALRLLALDTVVPGQTHGALCARRLAWLSQRLAEQPRRPTLVLMHHPPFATGIGWMDRYGLLLGAPELATIVGAHPQVERVLCGHLHRSIQARFAGTLASTCPSPAHQIPLELVPAGVERFVLEPPGYQLHRWADGLLVTHTAVIGDWPGPYRFD